MKSLRLIYVFIWFAIADLGWLIIRLVDAAPTKWNHFLLQTLMLVGIPTLLISLLVGLGCLLSLLWLVMAHQPQLITVRSEKIKTMLTILLLLITINSLAHYLLRPHPRDSQLIFTDSAVAVQDSMQVLRQMCESIDKDDFLSYHLRPDSTLFFSIPSTRDREDSLICLLRETPTARPIASLGPELGRIDTITLTNAGFSSITKETTQRLLTLLKFLNRNNIAGIVHDGSIWKYPYGMDYYRDNNRWFGSDKQRSQHQYLYVYKNPQDTIGFSQYTSIKDRKEHMILCEHKEGSLSNY